MPKALLIVDYTNDFVAPAGKLTAGTPAQSIAPAINRLAEAFRAQQDFVFLPTDLHVAGDPYHPETKLFPPHNEEGTWGRAYYGDLETWYQQHKAETNVQAFPKHRYSSFAGTPLDQWLRERHVTDLHIVGVCTDICVLHTAIDAYNLGYTITIHSDACATFNPDGQNFALDHFKNVLGATVL
ncbi:MAG: cysteine hydrolase [Lacticaseibacillus songhuajiangensis]|jgi:nicotinamidase-related amidase|nr:cysteine hydrolase [Lacticaseibacillus songhuajiangensis]